MKEAWRKRAAGAIGRYFERKRWPRLSLGLVMVVTGAAGFGASYGLLKLGMTTMWLRYPLAVFVAYGVFLGLLRVWVEIERAHFNPEDPELIEALENEGAVSVESSYELKKSRGSMISMFRISEYSIPRKVASLGY